MENQVRRAQAGFENDVNSMGVRLYNLIILLVDIIVVNIKWILYTIESVYHVFSPPPEVDVRGEIVLITGAAHGIGKELALQYARRGAIVVCWDINEKGNIETCDEIKAQGGKAHHYVCDVTKRQEILDVAEKVKKEVGIVSILVNNAGIMPCHPLLQHTEKEITTMYQINVLAHFWMIQAFLPDMIEKNRGHIVALSSCAGLFGLKNLVPYCGTKFAVRGYMQALQEELRADSRNPNVKFTTIYPYMVDTGLCKRPHARFEHLLKLVKPEEAAASIIEAQRRGIEEASVPRRYYYLEKYGRLFPRKAMVLVTDLLDTGVHSDL